uniref:Uncharacterized protein n=1 Tax=Glossina brevipalpis TaxID=37001 RepID=A0A1A9W0K0_9MUSC
MNAITTTMIIKNSNGNNNMLQGTNHLLINSWCPKMNQYLNSDHRFKILMSLSVSLIKAILCFLCPLLLLETECRTEFEVEAVLELKAAIPVNVSGVFKISSVLVAAADKRFLGDRDLGDFEVFVHSSVVIPVCELTVGFLKTKAKGSSCSCGSTTSAGALCSVVTPG